MMEWNRVRTLLQLRVPGLGIARTEGRSSRVRLNVVDGRVTLYGG